MRRDVLLRACVLNVSSLTETGSTAWRWTSFNACRDSSGRPRRLGSAMAGVSGLLMRGSVPHPATLAMILLTVDRQVGLA